MLLSLRSDGQNFWPVAVGLCAINVAHVVKSGIWLLVHRRSHLRLRLIHWTELQISAGYVVYFLGFALVCLGAVSQHFLPLFSVPYLIVTLMLFFSNIENNLFLAQKKFRIFEGVQLALIAAKFSMPQLINWNYALMFFMAGAIYLTVLGLLLTIILSCSLFGFLYRGLERWKVKSLLWMTLYYLFSGLTFIYVIKGVIEYYDDENIITREQTRDYVGFRSQNEEILHASAWMLIVFSFACLLMHVCWVRDIKTYLARVIYKNDLRKEVSLRTLSKDFSFRVIQYSAVFFKKTDAHAASDQKRHADHPQPESRQSTSLSQSREPDQSAENMQQTDCVVCFDSHPNIIHDPCGHGGVCKDCALEYIKNETTCMFCRSKIDRFYVIEYCPEQKCHFAKGEINLTC